MYLHSQMSVEPTDQVAIATEVHCVAESNTRVTFFCVFPLAVPLNRDAGLRNKQQHTHTLHDTSLSAPRTLFLDCLKAPPAKHAVLHLSGEVEVGRGCLGLSSPGKDSGLEVCVQAVS